MNPTRKRPVRSESTFRPGRFPAGYPKRYVAGPTREDQVTSPIVFFDIAGPDDQQLRQFYSNVFGWDVTDQSKFKVDVSAPLEGAIRKDSSEMRIYVGVQSVTDALEQIQANGGTVDAPRFEVPGVVVLGLFKDPAGNPMGLVELENGEVKIP